MCIRDRVKYVRKVLISNGFNEPRIIKKFNEPALNIFNLFSKDPFYCLIATKKKKNTEFTLESKSKN